MTKKIDKSSVYYAVARDQALRLVEKDGLINVLSVFNAIQWQIGFLGMPAKKINGYAQAAVLDLAEERELEIVTDNPDEYKEPRGYKGFLYRRASVLDRIVGAIEQDD